MNLKTWMRLGGILAVLLGVTPMLAVAQEYGRDRAEERGTIYIDNNRHDDQRDYHRGSHSYNRHSYHKHYYRGSHRYYRHSHRYYGRHSHPKQSYRYNHNYRHGYQNR